MRFSKLLVEKLWIEVFGQEWVCDMQTCILQMYSFDVLVAVFPY